MPCKDFPDTAFVKGSLCKWLRLARNRTGPVVLKDHIGTEYAVGGCEEKFENRRENTESRV